MFNNLYLIEKLIELEKRPTSRFLSSEVPPRPRRVNGLARWVGGAIRRTGERLESWAGESAPRPGADCFPETRHY